jgi:SET domain-containing protein
MYCGAGRWANDACDYDGVPDHLQLDRITNIKFRLVIAGSIHPTYQQYYVEMYALEDIKAGSELFVQYGTKYWEDATKYFLGEDHTIFCGACEEELEL